MSEILNDLQNVKNRLFRASCHWDPPLASDSPTQVPIKILRSNSVNHFARIVPLLVSGSDTPAAYTAHVEVSRALVAPRAGASLLIGEGLPIGGQAGEGSAKLWASFLSSLPSPSLRHWLGDQAASPLIGGRGGIVMETGSGDPPSPPPRPHASRSVLHVLKRTAPTPEALEVATNGSKPGLLVATANDATTTMDPGEATCNTTEVTLVANNTGKGADPGETRSKTLAMVAGDGFSANTVSVANSVAPVIAKAIVSDGVGMSSVALPRDGVVKSLPVPPASPTVIVVAPSPMTPPEKTSPTSPEGFTPHEFSAPRLPQDMGSQSSLGTTASKVPPASDTLSYLDSVSLMSGTLESLTGPGFLDDASSLGSDSEINGLAYRKTDKYGFLGGSQYSITLESAIPVDVARQRELKWLDMFSHWDKWLSRRFQKVKLRCRKGIPSSLRAKAWQLLSNSKEHLDQNQGKFEELERQPGDPKWLDVIEKDLHRQFPFHEMFATRGGHGQQDLYRILKAYTIYRPEEGYCQAQAPVAAVLLMHMPAEQAFWCLVQICEKYLPGYYSAGLARSELHSNSRHFESVWLPAHRRRLFGRLTGGLECSESAAEDKCIIIYLLLLRLPFEENEASLKCGELGCA
ncbi:TBC1 domain family member 10B [Crotalus adamanteus]|uniref:TBC1 domain family member 10B n=1 Tax=Crotalus adamanteus TaxID=8729 RepID=A0AAW1B0Q7_CROAD